MMRTMLSCRFAGILNRTCWAVIVTVNAIPVLIEFVVVVILVRLVFRL